MEGLVTLWRVRETLPKSKVESSREVLLITVCFYMLKDIAVILECMCCTYDKKRNDKKENGKGFVTDYWDKMREEWSVFKTSPVL